MNFEKFHPKSKVWVYTSSKEFNQAEIVALNKEVEEFCNQWTAHDLKLKASGQIAFNRLLVLIVDESEASASGCSIDKSVHFVKSLGMQMGCDFLIRNLVGTFQHGNWVWVDFKTIPSLLENGVLQADSLIVDHLVTDYQSFQNWLKPLSESWLSRFIKKTVQ